MEKEIERAIKLLAGKINADVKSDDALKFTQAAQNLGHVLGIVADIEIQKKRK